jgi:hypothetical protein
MVRSKRRTLPDPLFDLFERDVTTHFSFLRELGYEGPAIKKRKELAGRVFLASFKSDARLLIIGVVDPPDVKPFITLHVKRLPFRGIDDQMELTLFAEKYRPDLAAKIEQVGQQSPDLPSFIRAAFPLYRELLEGEAREVVEGKRWESGFYHRWD